MPERKISLNILNLDDIETAIRAVLADVLDKEAKEWFKINFFNHAKRTPEYFTEVRSQDELSQVYFTDQITQADKSKITRHNKLPDWASRALAFGHPVHVFRGFDKDKVRELSDWWNSLDPRDRHRKRFSRISVEDAFKLATQWHERLIRHAEEARDSGDDPDGIKLITEFEDNYRIVKVFSRIALVREGAIMGHCVGSYARQVEDGYEVYSLRDAKNRPHATVGIREGTIDQLQGKGNTQPIGEYLAYLREWLVTTEYNLGHYAELLGIFTIQDRRYSCTEDILTVGFEKKFAENLPFSCLYLLPIFNAVTNMIWEPRPVIFLELLRPRKPARTRKLDPFCGFNVYELEIAASLFMVREHGALTGFGSLIQQAIQESAKKIIAFIKANPNVLIKPKLSVHIGTVKDFFIYADLYPEYKAVSNEVREKKKRVLLEQISEARTTLRTEKNPAKRSALVNLLQVSMPRFEQQTKNLELI